MRQEKGEGKKDQESNPPLPRRLLHVLFSFPMGGLWHVVVFYARCLSIIIRGTPPFLFRPLDYSDFWGLQLRFVWRGPRILQGREFLSLTLHPAYHSLYSDLGYRLLRFLGLAGGLGGGVPPVWRAIWPVAPQGSGVHFHCFFFKENDNYRVSCCVCLLDLGFGEGARISCGDFRRASLLLRFWMGITQILFHSVLAILEVLRGRRGIWQHCIVFSSLGFTQIFFIPSTPFWRKGRGLRVSSRPFFG